MRPEEFARLVIENHVKGNGKPELPIKLTGVDVEKAGAFVSLKTLDGDLRGCIGTIAPTRESVVEEIMHNAISSATKDPRFPPVQEFELDSLKYSVDVLHLSEKVSSLDELDPKVYGIIVSSEKGRQALLLPDLEGLDTIEKQVAACMRKAGISLEEKIAVQRFKVDRFSQGK
ncbi:MAG: AmmeMemoRadiSam system protein A [Candidatus Melainabacteria bacterium GWF2_37_15]|nr:MAG: AmmeMemoRadiSam system protein A [Candidatus Melainabacteria bacterium GWF2_37_15]